MTQATKNFLITSICASFVMVPLVIVMIRTCGTTTVTVQEPTPSPSPRPWVAVDNYGDSVWASATFKMRVDGGWLYRQDKTACWNGNLAVGTALVFVPDTASVGSH